MLNLKIFALLILEVEFKMVSSILIIHRVGAVLASNDPRGGGAPG